MMRHLLKAAWLDCTGNSYKLSPVLLVLGKHNIKDISGLTRTDKNYEIPPEVPYLIIHNDIGRIHNSLRLVGICLRPIVMGHLPTM